MRKWWQKLVAWFRWPEVFSEPRPAKPVERPSTSRPKRFRDSVGGQPRHGWPEASPVPPFVPPPSEFLKTFERLAGQMLAGHSTTVRVETRTIKPGTTLRDDSIIYLTCASCGMTNRLMLKEQRGRRCGKCGLPLAIGRKM